MNMRDLSRDDDFLSHLLVEKLGTGDVPLVVHKMDPSRKVPKTSADDLLQIIRRMVVSKGSQQTIIKQAVDDLISLNGVKYYLKSSSYDQKQINAFATHASRYFELYLPIGSIEIAHTSRYSHQTGKSELCILATRPLAPGTVVSELKGSMADLTEEEDKELKRTGERHADGVGIRRDFSVIHSKQLKKNHLFLGPARFVNHDCDHNVELFREGRYITFRVIKPIGVGEEVTAHYGDGYFGRKNRHCLCATCEKNGRGGYAPQGCDDELSDTASGSGNDGRLDEGSSSQSSDSEGESDAETLNCNERRTRRGVYAVMPEPSASGELNGEAEARPASSASVPTSAVQDLGLMTPEPENELRGRALHKGKGRATAPIAPVPRKATPSLSVAAPFKSVIFTRARKAREASLEASASARTSRAPSKTVTGRSVSAARQQLITPPLTNDSAATSVRSSSRLRSAGDTASSVTESSRVSTPVRDKKGKGRATASVSDVRDRDQDTHEPEARHLRPRASATVFNSLTLSKKKQDDAPRGLDGKPLPMCSTCHNILPVISVDCEIVWGLSVGRTGKRGRPKKDVAADCPRCLRHFAIYGHKWPERVLGDGSRLFLPVHHIISTQYRKVTPSALAAVNRKLAVAVTTTHKRQAEQVGDEVAKPVKKKATTTPMRTTVTKVKMSAKARQILSGPLSQDRRRSSRPPVPSLKLRETDPAGPKTRASPRLASDPSPPSVAPESPHSPPTISASPTTPTNASLLSPKNITPKSLAVAAQPRDANGRFGKKAATNGRFVRKKFTIRKQYSLGHKMLPRPTAMKSGITLRDYDQEDQEGVDYDDDEDDDDDEDQYYRSSDPFTEVEFGEEALEDVVLKRTHDSDSDQSPRKKIRISESDASDESPTISPRFAMGRGSLLRPNPIAFARRKWAFEDLESSVSNPRTRLSTGMNTGESAVARLAPAAIITSRRSGDELYEGDAPTGTETSPSSVPPARLLAPAPRIASITFRPSPMNLAKRRWASGSEGPATWQPSLLGESRKFEQAHDHRNDDLPSTASSHKPHSHSESIGDLAYPDYDDSDVYSSDEDYYSSDESAVPAPLELSSGRSATLGYPIKASSYSRTDRHPDRVVDHGYPRGRATSPVYRPASFSLSRAATPRLAASISSLASTMSSFDNSPQLRPQSEKADCRTHPLSRITLPTGTGGDSTDDSERVVERLVGVGYTAPTSKASTSTPPLPLTAAAPESPPGYAWKRTVLIPTNHTLRLPTNISFPIPTWQHDARRLPIIPSLPPLSQSLSSVPTAPGRPGLSTRPVTPLNIIAPKPISPAQLFNAGWDSSDTDSP